MKATRESIHATQRPALHLAKGARGKPRTLVALRLLARGRHPAHGRADMFGYSDQAPGWLRAVTLNLDAMFGFPILWLIKLVAA
jgi:hypothetical protein